MIPGCDVSSFQGLPGSWRPQAGAINWAAVKFTEVKSDGTVYLSPDAAADWTWLKAHGKGRIAYCFGHPSASAGSTAAAIVNQLHHFGMDDGDGVALDLEVTDGLSAAAVADWARTVMGLLERDLDRAPVLYTYLSFAEAGNCAGLGQYNLWMSDPSSPAGRPRIPAPWKTYAIHQFATTGAIDRDLAAWASLADMRKALGKKEPAVTSVTGDGKSTLRVLAGEHKTYPSALLRATAIQDGKYPADVAAWINQQFGGLVPPKGATFRLPKGAK